MITPQARYNKYNTCANFSNCYTSVNLMKHGIDEFLRYYYYTVYTDYLSMLHVTYCLLNNPHSMFTVNMPLHIQNQL